LQPVFKIYVTYSKCIRINDSDTWVLISARSYWRTIAGISRTVSVYYNFQTIRRAVCEFCTRTAVYRSESAASARTRRIGNWPKFRLCRLAKFSNLIEPPTIRAGIVGEIGSWKLYVIFTAVEWVRVSL